MIPRISESAEYITRELIPVQRERERKKNEYLRKQALSQDGNNLYDQISKIVQLFFNNTKVFKENFDERNIMLVIPQCIYTYCL